jgi:hypothetical protein
VGLIKTERTRTGHFGRWTRRRAALGALAAAAAAAVGAPAKSRAQSAPDLTGSPYVGSWRATAVLDGSTTPFTTLSTYMADGTVVNSGSPVAAAPAGAAYRVVFSSAAHGNWDVLPDGSAATTFVRLQADENGAFLGEVKVRSTLRFDDSSQIASGPFTFEEYDAGGQLVGTAAGTVELVRMPVEPLSDATPAATPAG